MEIIQSLTEPCDRKTYGIRKREAAKKLGVTLRSIERLLKKHQEQGLVGLTQTRSDKESSVLVKIGKSSSLKPTRRAIRAANECSGIRCFSR
jgi:hypothetical protein